MDRIERMPILFNECVDFGKKWKNSEDRTNLVEILRKQGLPVSSDSEWCETLYSR